MLTRTLAIGLAIGLAGAALGQTDEAKPQQEEAFKPLVVGDKAPPLHIAEWVKGKPVKQFESGKLYVVEFWATWCGPCIAGMPHLSELQAEYEDRDVRFIGVNIWDDPANVAPFMKERTSRRTGEALPSGDELMKYTVAIEEKEEDGETGKMAKAWMEAAGQNGIPAAFLINREGRVAWIGHPSQIDEPLEQVIAGTWDLEAEAARSRKQAEKQARARPFEEQYRQARAAGDLQGQLDAIDALVDIDDETYGQLRLRKVEILVAEQRKYEQGYGIARELVAKEFKDNAMALNALSWMILTHPNIQERDKELALSAAKRANELTDSDNPAVLDTLAKAYFDSGDVENAIRYQQMAVDKVQGRPEAAEFQDRLEQYRQAKNKG